MLKAFCIFLFDTILARIIGIIPLQYNTAVVTVHTNYSLTLYDEVPLHNSYLLNLCHKPTLDSKPEVFCDLCFTALEAYDEFWWLVC